jgi:hypothetical protein
MATESSTSGLGIGDTRVQVGFGLLLSLVGFVGLSGVLPLPLTDWANWYLFTGLFFGGVLVTLLTIQSD